VAQRVINPDIMNEKELVILLAENSDELDLLLTTLRENTKGNLQFKKMKLRRVIKKNPDFDFIGEIFEKWDKLGIPDFSAYDLPILLKQINSQGFSKLMQYFIIARWYQPFIDENFNAIFNNATNGNNPFHGLHGFDNDRDLELFYQNNFDEVQGAKDESELGSITQWFETSIISLDHYKNRLIAVDLPEFDRLIESKTPEPDLLISPSFLKREDRSHYPTENIAKEHILNLITTVDKEGLKLALYLAYLDVGMYNPSIKSTLLDSMQRHYLTFKMQLAEVMKVIDESILTNKYHTFMLEHNEMLEKLQKMEKNYETTTENLNSHLEALQTENERMASELEAKKQHFLELNQQMLVNEASVVGYRRMLSDDFTTLKLAVVYDADLLYAPVIFPDVYFCHASEITADHFDQFKIVLIQEFGSSVKRITQLEADASSAGCDVFKFPWKDERQLIMEISHVMKGRCV